MTQTATIVDVAAIEDRIEHRDFRAALALIEKHNRSNKSASQEDRLWLDVMKGECLAFLGECRDSVSLCKPAASVLRHGSNHALYARACFAMAVAQLMLGELDEATENANLALYSSKRADDYAGVVRAANKLANIISDKGDLEHALASYDECIATAREHGMPRWDAVAGDNKARIYLFMGRLKEARVAFSGSRAYLVAHGEDLNVARHDLSVAYLNILDRRFDRAEAILRRMARGPLDSLPNREHGIWFEYMGELEYSRGRLEEAETHLLRAIAIGNASASDESLIGQSSRILAEVRLAEGHVPEAEAQCRQALTCLRTVSERIEEGAAYRTLGGVCAAQGKTDAAREAFRDGVSILSRIGARLEWAKTSLAAGQCAVLEERERLGYLFEAERLFDEIGVAYWIEETRSALQEILSARGARSVRQAKDDDTVETAPVIVTQDRTMRETLRMAERYAQGDLAVLITGETGTGKDLLARYIRWVSPRRHQPFLTIDLSVIAENLWESELFGHRKGTFTGAAGEKIGLFESADGGTVFLNEIGNLPLDLQKKLLHFLDTHEVRPIGATHSKKLDVRLIAATNAELRKDVESGAFRSDLYYRLEAAPLHLTPLRFRRDDIPLLLAHFLEEADASPTVLANLSSQRWLKTACAMDWEGNVRELQNFAYRVVRLSGPRAPMREFTEWAEQIIGFKGRVARDRDGNGDERARVLDVLERNDWIQRAAARDLQISESGLRHMMRRLGIERPVG